MACHSESDKTLEPGVTEDDIGRTDVEKQASTESFVMGEGRHKDVRVDRETESISIRHSRDHPTHDRDS